MAVYTYNPYRGTDLNITEENPFNRTELLPRMYHPDGTYWNGNRTIIRWLESTKAVQCNREACSGKGRGTRVVNIQALKVTGSSLILT